MIDAKRIEEMKRLSADATEGPWWASWSYSDKPAEVNVNRAEGYSVSISAELEDEDAQFIAESRQFVPDIIAAYEEQAEEIAKLRKALEFYADDRNYYTKVEYDVSDDGGKIAREALNNANL